MDWPCHSFGRRMSKKRTVQQLVHGMRCRGWPRKIFKDIIKSKYNQINDAHFGTSKIPVIDGYDPNYENGKFIYEAGCLHCHAPERGITNFDLDTNQITLRFLHNKKDKYSGVLEAILIKRVSHSRGFVPQFNLFL